MRPWGYALALVAASLTRPASAAPAPLAGRLAGTPFTPRKILLLEGGDWQELHFSDDAGGAPCDKTILDHYVEVSSVRTTRAKPIFVPGQTVTLATENVVVIHYKPDIATRPKDLRLALTIDAIDAAHGKASGRIDWAAEDDSSLSGPFEATYCATKAKVAATTPSGNGVAWTQSKVAAATVPRTEPQGILIGNPFHSAYANVIAYESLRGESYFHEELNFFAEKPAQPCTDIARAKSDGFTVLFKTDTVARGPVEPSSRPIVRWREPGASYLTVDDSHASNLTLVFDAVDRKRKLVKGRIYLAVDDDGKSLLIGSFSASYCAEPGP